MTAGTDKLISLASDLAAAQAVHEKASDRVSEAEGALPEGHPARWRLWMVEVGESQIVAGASEVYHAAKRQGLDPEPFVAEWERLMAERMTARKAAGIPDDEADEARQKYWEARSRIGETPAETLAGLTVKVQQLCWAVDDGGDGVDDVLARGILADCERLAGEYQRAGGVRRRRRTAARRLITDVELAPSCGIVGRGNP